MVFTLGFLSILAFAGILATSGSIASRCFDDLAMRLHLSILTRPWAACVIWGGMYYLWMVVIAALGAYWKVNKLGDEQFDMRDGYWWAYISSTTVGLGDIFFEPEVFTWADLFLFPFLFLISFVLVSAFLGKFAEMIKEGCCASRMSIVEDLMAKLEVTDITVPMPTTDGIHEGVHSAARGTADLFQAAAENTTDLVNIATCRVNATTGDDAEKGTKEER